MPHIRTSLLLAALTACRTPSPVDPPPVTDPDVSDTSTDDTAGPDTDPPADSDAEPPLSACLPRRTRDRVTGAPWVVASSYGSGATRRPREALYYHPGLGPRVQGAYMWDDPRTAIVPDLDYPLYLSGFVELEAAQSGMMSGSLHIDRTSAIMVKDAGSTDPDRLRRPPRNGSVLIDADGRLVPGSDWHEAPLPVDAEVCGLSQPRSDDPAACTVPVVPGGPRYRDLAGYCWIDPEGVLTCDCEGPNGTVCRNHVWEVSIQDEGPWVSFWGQSANAAWGEIPNIAHAVCALDCAGRIGCWGPLATEIEAYFGDRAWTEMIQNSRVACGVTPAGVIDCTTLGGDVDPWYERLAENHPAGVGFHHVVAADALTFLALDANGGVHMWTPEAAGLRPTLETGFVALGSGCALRDDGTLACWGTGGLAESHPTREP